MNKNHSRKKSPVCLINAVTCSITTLISSWNIILMILIEKSCSAETSRILFYAFKRQFHKIVQQIQTIRPQCADKLFAEELFECVWPFCRIGA